jgi:hypothetical protein
VEDVVYHLGLESLRQLMVERELFDNQVKIMEEGVSNVVAKALVEVGRDVEGLVGSFDFVYPKVKVLQPLVH